MGQVTFSYKGRNAEGMESCGVVEAASKEDALQKLKLLETQGLRDIVIESAQQDTTPPQQPTVQNAPAKPSKPDVELKIDKLLKQGFVVQYRDEYRTQLIKPKKFSYFFFLLWFVGGLMVGGFVYLIYYFWVKKDKVIMLNL